MIAKTKQFGLKRSATVWQRFNCNMNRILKFRILILGEIKASATTRWQMVFSRATNFGFVGCNNGKKAAKFPSQHQVWQQKLG